MLLALRWGSWCEGWNRRRVGASDEAARRARNFLALGRPAAVTALERPKRPSADAKGPVNGAARLGMAKVAISLHLVQPPRRAGQPPLLAALGERVACATCVRCSGRGRCPGEEEQSGKRPPAPLHGQAAHQARCLGLPTLVQTRTQSHVQGLIPFEASMADDEAPEQSPLLAHPAEDRLWDRASAASPGRGNG